MTSDKCGAKLRGRNEGKFCELAPAEGAKRCWRHGGGSPQAKKKAAERVAQKEAKELMERTVQTLGLPVDIDPGKALLNEIARTYGAVMWLESKVRELSPDALVWGVAQTETGVGPQGPVDTETSKAEPSAWYVLYMNERKHLVTVTTAALKAGIEERRIKIAEDQGQLVASAIRAILGALHLTPEQQALVPQIVPQQLRLLAGGAS